MKEYVRLNRIMENADVFSRERLKNILENGILPAVTEILTSIPMLYPDAGMEPLYEIIENYGKAAKRAVEAGFDAVELHAAHNYLPHVMMSGGFNHRDDEWGGTQEKHWFSLDFHVNEVLYRQKAELWTGCTAQCYKECMKAYIAFQLGRYSLVYLQQTANSLRSLAGKNADEAKILPPDERVQTLRFLQLLPANNDLCDQVIEALEDSNWTKPSRKPRQLADFSCYLRFNRELDSYWNVASEEEKKFYFPVYFWWKLTAILPLRCTEFLLTPRNCIRQESGKDFLLIRRTRLKKGRRQLSYSVQDDYVLQEYEIPPWLFDEIQHYQSATTAGVCALFPPAILPTSRWLIAYSAFVKKP